MLFIHSACWKKKAKKGFEEIKPTLVTNQGFSRPATLRLLAFAASELHDTNCNGSMQFHWIPDLPYATQEIFYLLWKQTKLNPHKNK